MASIAPVLRKARAQVAVMADNSSIPPEFLVASTLIFPITGNPIGFNHFAAAEAILRQNRSLERVLFVLSNGRHPDPTKPDAEAAPEMRLELCRLASAAVSDPERCFLARLAAQAGAPLLLAPERLEVSTLEFSYPRAVRTAELAPLLRARLGGGTERLHWFAGADLVRRMADPRIFGNADLELLAEHSHYHILEREGDPADKALEALRGHRGIALTATVYPLASLPDWLAPFLSLSSTLIRDAAEAGDPLAGMLPRPAADRIAGAGLYRPGRPEAHLTGAGGEALAPLSGLGLSGLGLRLDALRGRVEEAATELFDALTVLREQGRPHSLALVETSTGGLLTAALAGRGGASRFFLQSRFAYDARSKAALVFGDPASGDLAGAKLPGGSAVSREAVEALAVGMRAEAGSDFALAESGMAGPPDGGRRSLKNGLCWIAWAGPEGVHGQCVRLNPFLTRREHQLSFALHALQLAATAVARDAPADRAEN